MDIKNTVIRLIEENLYLSAPVTEESDLYADLGFDSLSFIALLTGIEETYRVTFGIAEMEACLQVGRLVAAVEGKVKGRGRADD